MTDYRTETTSTITALHEPNRRLAELMPRLERPNEAFAEAASPLHARGIERGSEEREIGGRLRAAERELEEVTELIKQVHAAAPPDGHDATATATPQVT